MIVIHVIRKPLGEATVAQNALKYGTGGLNIDASRISTSDNLNGGAYAQNASDRSEGYENWRFKRGDKGNLKEFQQPTGRWPSNIILQHRAGCTETECSADCSIPWLDAQSGHTTNHGGVIRRLGTDTQSGWHMRNGATTGQVYTDSGGASRFFKSVQVKSG